MKFAYAPPGGSTSSGGGSAPAGGGAMGLIIWLLVLFLMFYFLLILPQRKKERDFRRMISSLKRGDKIVTVGGIVGKVIDIRKDTVKIKVANTTELEVTKRSIASVLAPRSVEKEKEKEKEENKEDKKES
ncbi:MAG TPA: preprotein translocase subunit YajC [Thermotogales bacterium]|nr:preprotein translocase subunit YajC [Thermotogales bacterium]